MLSQGLASDVMLWHTVVYRVIVWHDMAFCTVITWCATLLQGVVYHIARCTVMHRGVICRDMAWRDVL